MTSLAVEWLRLCIPVQRDVSLIPGQGAKSPPTLQPKYQNVKQKQYCNKFSYICCLQETHLKTRDTYRLKVKGWKKIFYANGDQKKAGVAIFISEILIVCNILIFQKYIQKATEKSPACFDTSVMCQNRTFSSSEMFAEIMRLG